MLYCKNGVICLLASRIKQNSLFLVKSGFVENSTVNQVSHGIFSAPLQVTLAFCD